MSLPQCHVRVWQRNLPGDRFELHEGPLVIVAYQWESSDGGYETDFHTERWEDLYIDHVHEAEMITSPIRRPVNVTVSFRIRSAHKIVDLVKTLPSWKTGRWYRVEVVPDERYI